MSIRKQPEPAKGGKRLSWKANLLFAAVVLTAAALLFWLLRPRSKAEPLEAVVDFGDGIIEAVNPEIVSTKGMQEGPEGCLSFPGEYGIVRRPQKAKLKAQDRHGKWFTLTGEDLVARCICHENDHLDGIVFKQHVIRMLGPDEY